MRSALSGVGVTAERPVRRDPHSGAILIWPTYEGWRPAAERTRSSWWLVAAGAVIVLAARFL